MPFRVMHRKEVTHSNGSYERKSCGRKLADEIGRGKKKIPLYSHRLTHRKRVTSELHDSYFRSMTITQAITKIAEVTHPDRQISEEIAEAWRRVHITAWEFKVIKGRRIEQKAVELSRVGVGGGRDSSKESQHPAEWTPGLWLISHGERERHNADGHNFGIKIFQLCSVSSSLSHANLG